LLAQTVRSLLAARAVPAELIIIDQSDAPNAELRALVPPDGTRVRYEHLDRAGASLARNTGAALASSEWLLFLDDDLTVDPGWLAAVVDELTECGPETVVTGQVREAAGAAGKFAPSCAAGESRVLSRGRIPRDVLSSGNMGLHRVAFQRAGGFDDRLGPGTRFPAAEDNDLGLRLLELGYSILFLPQALAWHHAWRNEGDVFSLQWRYGLGQGAFYAKHLRAGRGFIWRRALRDVLRPVRSFPERFRSRRLRRLFGDLAYAAGVLVSLTLWTAVCR
jgi:GT2 family glycosyltransferase